MSSEHALVTVRTIDGFHHQVQVRGLTFNADIPPTKGGGDEGPTPTELVLGALGSCLSITMLTYARRHDWPLRSVEVDVRTDGEKIEQLIRLKGDLDSDQQERLLKVADKSPVHKLLSRAVEVVNA